MLIVHRDTDYAIRALIYLATRPDVVPVSELADRLDVPKDFLRKIMQKLNRAGLVDATRGVRGGYRLARDPGDVTAKDVLEITQGPVCVSPCLHEPCFCPNGSSCPLNKRLGLLEQQVIGWLEDISLAGLVADLETPANEGEST